MSVKTDFLYCPECGARMEVGKLFGCFFLTPVHVKKNNCFCTNFLEYHSTRENVVNAWGVAFARYKREH